MLGGGGSPAEMFPHSPSSRLCNRRRLSNGPDILLCDFYEHSSLRVGAEQEQLAFGDPVSGSGAAEPLSNRRRKHGKADGEAYCSPGLLGQGQPFAAGNHLVLRRSLSSVLAPAI